MENFLVEALSYAPALIIIVGCVWLFLFMFSKIYGISTTDMDNRDKRLSEKIDGYIEILESRLEAGEKREQLLEDIIKTMKKDLDYYRSQHAHMKALLINAGIISEETMSPSAEDGVDSSELMEASLKALQFDKTAYEKRKKELKDSSEKT